MKRYGLTFYRWLSLVPLGFLTYYAWVGVSDVRWLTMLIVFVGCGVWEVNARIRRLEDAVATLAKALAEDIRHRRG